MRKNRVRGWVVARFNLDYENFGEAISTEERVQSQIKIIDVVLNETEAEKDVNRLNKLNKSKRNIYFYQPVGVKINA